MSDRLKIARAVAEHWHRAATVTYADEPEWIACGHALAMVLAAMDGETDPAELGIRPGREWVDFRDRAGL